MEQSARRISLDLIINLRCNIAAVLTKAAKKPRWTARAICFRPCSRLRKPAKDRERKLPVLVVVLSGKINFERKGVVMCNAWNHPRDCRCGWGGVGHTGRAVARNNISKGVANKFYELESYLIPNAKCPVCKSYVFFYQSENGGRVFFDRLGPPWPKHPCTDANSATGADFYVKHLSEEINLPISTDSVWRPLVVLDITPLPPKFNVFRVRALTHEAEKITIYTTKSKLKSRAPYYIKLLDEKEYEVSTVEVGKDSVLNIKFRAFNLLSDVKVYSVGIKKTFKKTVKSINEVLPYRSSQNELLRTKKQKRRIEMSKLLKNINLGDLKEK